MNLSNVRVAPKLWATILGLLIVMTLSNLWVQQSTMRTMQTSREDVQRIERKIALAETMRGKILRSIESGIAMQATNEARLQDAFGERFKKLYKVAFAALEEMQAALVTERDRKSFDIVLAAFDDLKKSRERASQTIDLDDYNARANYALGEYVQYAEIYGEKIGDFIDLQRLQLKELMQAADDARDSASMMGWIITGALLLLGVFLTRWLVLNVTRPLQQVVDATQTIGGGDFTLQLHTDRKDEFGQLLNALDQMSRQLSGLALNVRGGVSELLAAATEIAKGNQDLSARTEQTAANLEESASSIEQLTATVNQSAETSRQANQLASSAVTAAECGGQVVQQVVESMEHINASSRKINDIIGVIDGIAFQTNILALNAAVEAARAGEQGRGFAVVAGEVRSLAQRSAEAAKEIKELITTSVTSVQTGTHQVAQAGQSMAEIVSSVRRVTDLIGEITAATSEQREGFVQVNQAVSNLDQMTQQNAALVEESSAAANAMSEQASRLMERMSVFKTGEQPDGMAMAAAKAPAGASVLQAPARAAVPVQAKAKAPAAVAQPVASKSKPIAAPKKVVAATADDDWETF